MSRKSVVIIAHGFKGFKDWGFMPYFGEKLAEVFGEAITFNFSHNGIGNDPSNLTELELFQNNTLQKEEDDLKIVLEAYRAGKIQGVSGPCDHAVALLGHSRGGSAVLRVAGSDTENRIAAIGLLASIAEYPTVSQTEADLWRKEGVRYVENVRTKQQLPLGLGLLNELVYERDKLPSAAKKVLVPALIVHGAKDQTVPVSALARLKDYLRNHEAVVLPESDHVFGATHPFQGPTEDFENVLILTCNFFSRYL